MSSECHLMQESSQIRSNANLGVHGQGLLNLSGPGDAIEAQRLVLSLFYSVNVSRNLVLYRIVFFFFLFEALCNSSLTGSILSFSRHT